MTVILELREKFYHFVGKRERLALAAFKFAAAFLVFFYINSTVGYMEALQTPVILLALAAVCAFTPNAVTILCSAALILLNFYSLAVGLCLITLLVCVIVFCIYFRFARESGIYAVLTPLFFVIRCPYVLPNAMGMTKKPHKVISVLIGTLFYFLIKNVSENEAMFRSFDESSTDISVYTLAINQILGNKEMFIYMAVFVAAAIVVYCVRRLQADHAWSTSIIVGTSVQLVLIGGSQIIFGDGARSVLVTLAGCLVSLLLSYGFLFMVRTLDYSRVERVQFEDDDYYYYVKAVPKTSVAPQEKQVKQISRTAETSRGRKHRHEEKAEAIPAAAQQSETDSPGEGMTEEQKDLARRAMKEFNVDGDWLE